MQLRVGGKQIQILKVCKCTKLHIIYLIDLDCMLCEMQEYGTAQLIKLQEFLALILKILGPYVFVMVLMRPICRGKT